MSHRSIRRLSFAIVLVFVSLALCSATSSPSLTSFDPSDWTVHMPSAERAYRAAHMPGGEPSYCCCYCGRGVQHDQEADATDNADGQYGHNEIAGATVAAGAPAADSWLYAPLPRQPRPERGDPTDRLRRLHLSRSGRKRGGKRKQQKRRPSNPPATAEPDAEEEQRLQLEAAGGGDTGVATFFVYHTVESSCDNEYCRTRSDVCLRSHLWTGWAGVMTVANGRPPLSVVQQRCSNVYQREMEVLADFNRVRLTKQHAGACAVARPRRGSEGRGWHPIHCIRYYIHSMLSDRF